jgi:hypothetical protein
LASLRRKPQPDAAATSADAADSVAIVDQPSTPPPDSALKAQLEALRHSETIAQAQQHRAALAAEAEERRHRWLASNQAAQAHFSALPELHRLALDAGFTDTSPDYFRFMDSQLDALQAQRGHPAHVIEDMHALTAQHRPPEPPEPNPARYVSAPVSRDGSHFGSSPRSIRLTKEQIEFARMSGITEADYARELMRLNQLKADGHYGERR